MATPAWRPVPGLESARLLSLLRRPDICCSNSYLVAGPHAVLGIDPGADAAQAALFARLAGEALAAAPRPFVVLLTHCHVDHVLQAAARPERLVRLGGVLAAHAGCAEVLAEGDPVRSAAEYFEVPLPRVEVDLPLFSTIPPSAREDIRRIPCRAGDLRGERLVVGGAPVAEVFAAPGHTPDSVVVRIGDLLFVGDLLFALEPGVAGLPGFDSAALAATVGAVRSLVREGGIVEVCPGHGRVLLADAAAAALARIERALDRGTAVPRITPARITATRVVAVELLDEADRLFAVIGGRLLALAYHLEALGEAEAAARIEAALAADDVEPCLASFARFAREYEAGDRIEYQVVLKAVQATRRIEAILRHGRLAAVGDLALLSRFRRLADDFTATVTGGAPAVARVAVDLNEAVGDVAAAVGGSAAPDGAVLDAADDEAAFLEVLIRRLAAPALYPDGGLAVSTAPGSVPVATDPDRLGDGLRALLEDLAGAGHARVGIGVEERGAIAIRGDPEGAEPFGLRRLEAYRRRFGAIGAVFEVEDGEAFAYRILFGR